MKTFTRLILTKGLLSLLLLFLISLNTARAQAPDSKGQDFWITFPENLGESPTTQTVFLTGDVATTGLLNIPGLSFSTPFTITPGTVTSIPLPLSVQITNSNVIENKGIHITANAEVTVYGLNNEEFSTDAFLALPTDILGTEYINLGYQNVDILNATQLAIVGTANSTIVTIKPTVTTNGHAAGVPYNITLNQGQTYLLRNTGSYPNDLTGTEISATKPVAVFGGHRCANIPRGDLACDYVIEQLPPVSAWGREFVTVPLATRLNGDTFRFVASENMTQIRINGTVVANLNRGQYHEQIIVGAANITATKPILVAQYSNSSTFDNVTADPFMMLIPPFEQFLGNYTVSTPATGFARNFINVVAPTAAVGSIKLDGTTVPAASFSPIGSSGFVGAQLAVSLGSHTLTGGNFRFGAFVYGFNNFNSYGYPGGQSLSKVAEVQTIAINIQGPATAQVGTEHCLTATALDQNNQPIEGVPIDFDITGANTVSGFQLTDANGVARFCYTGTNAGTDNIVASSGTVTANAQLVWTPACTAPDLTVPSITPVTNDFGLCSASVTFAATAIGSPDPAIVYTILVDGVEQTITSPYIFPVGTTTITATATNNCGVDTETFNVIVNNNAPVITSVTGPAAPVAINTALNLTIAYNDNNGTNAAIDWGDRTSIQNVDNPANSFTTSHTYAAAGVYTVNVTLTDACGESSNVYAYQYVVVYDPNGGFVTGGGWIDSPAGAYTADPTLTGKANFGFVSKYQKGATIPTGNTQFQFHAGSLNFHSTSYDWLVIAGSKAQFKGRGTVNGSGDYGFMLSSVDGNLTSPVSADKFRIKIWDRTTNAVVYDNQMTAADDAVATTAIANGSIVIHSGGKKSERVTDQLEMAAGSTKLNAYPSPFSQKTTVEISFKQDMDYTLDVYDLRGSLVKRLQEGKAKGGAVVQASWEPKDSARGVYIIRLVTQGGVHNMRIVRE